MKPSYVLLKNQPNVLLTGFLRRPAIPQQLPENMPAIIPSKLNFESDLKKSFNEDGVQSTRETESFSDIEFSSDAALLDDSLFAASENDAIEAAIELGHPDLVASGKLQHSQKSLNLLEDEDYNFIFSKNGYPQIAPKDSDITRKPLAEEEPEIISNFLEKIKALIRILVAAGNVYRLNAGFLLLHVKTTQMYLQDNCRSFGIWIQFIALDMGVSSNDLYRLLRSAWVMSKYPIVFVSWGLKVSDLVDYVDKIHSVAVGLTNGLSINDMKEPFLSFNNAQFENFCSNGGCRTSDDNLLITKKRSERASQNLLTTTPTEELIVRCIRVGMIPKFVWLQSAEDSVYITIAIATWRRECYESSSSRLAFNPPPRPADLERVFMITSIPEAKEMLKSFLTGIVDCDVKLAVLTARLCDDPNLQQGLREEGYESAKELLVNELNVPYDPLEYALIGRNYIKYESLILSNGGIETMNAFKKLRSLDQAIQKHGDKASILWRFFQHEDLTSWRCFIDNANYEPKLLARKMSLAKLKEARRILFEFQSNPPRENGLQAQNKLRGSYLAVIPVANATESTMVDRFLADPSYISEYMALFAKYKEADSQQ